MREDRQSRNKATNKLKAGVGHANCFAIQEEAKAKIIMEDMEQAKDLRMNKRRTKIVYDQKI